MGKMKILVSGRNWTCCCGSLCCLLLESGACCLRALCVVKVDDKRDLGNFERSTVESPSEVWCGIFQTA